MTKLEKIHYHNKCQSLGITYDNVLGLFHDVRGTKIRLSRELNISTSRISSALSGRHYSPQILLLIHYFLKGKESVKWAKNLRQEQKNVTYLTQNGFSLWEAVQISKK